MNLIDRALGAFAPTFAAKRAAARLALDQINRAQASYRGAQATRVSSPWQRSDSYRGGQSWQRIDYGTMRDRARRVYRENHIGRSLLDLETDYVVADGLTLESKVAVDDKDPNKAWDREAEDRWSTWIDRSADIRGMMCASEMFRSSWRDPRKDGDGGFAIVRNGFELQLQFVPGDKIGGVRMGRGYAAKKTDKIRIQDGVETDDMGRPIRFWIEDQDELGKLTQTPVAAADFVYLPHLNDPLDLRGVSCYAQIFERLDQLDGYVDAVVIAARMAAIFGLIFKEETAGRQLAGLPIVTNSQGQNTRAVTLEEGQIKYLGKDGQVVQVQAGQPLQQTPDFIRAVFRLICQSFDMPLEIGARDLSQVTFVGGRLGLLGYKRAVQVKQDWITSLCWNRIYERWLDNEREKQRLKIRNSFKTPFPRGTDGAFLAKYPYEFHAPEFPASDPKAEAEADLLEISMGIKTPQMSAGARSRDWRRMQVDLKAARDSNKTNDIPNVYSQLTRPDQPVPGGAPPKQEIDGAD